MNPFHRTQARWLCVLPLLASAGLTGCAGLDDGSLRQATQVAMPGAGDAGRPAEADIAAGLREALVQGVGTAVATLGRSNGYWSNAAVRIPLPEPVQKAENTLRRMGQGARVDEFHLTLNRAAERAVPEVADIVGDAVRSMSLADARSILDGGGDAATRYFQRAAGPALEARVRPIVAAATAQVGVTQQYKSLVSSYGPLLALAGVDNADLDAHVTRKAVDGLFFVIAAEEARIRRDPRARSTELLRRVFGGP